jgi:2-keto-4-pentenoate hydratase/2-oxohepta-3-ene-1,7-dioic acid hydratase in catechol pathway
MTTERRYARLPSRTYVEIDGNVARALDAAPWLGGRPTGQTSPFRGDFEDLLAPVEPSKILCVGRNYKAHAQELGNEVPKEPLLFWKPPSSVLAPRGTLELPPAEVSSRVDQEAEIALVIGKTARHVSVERALDHVFGVTLAFDITARDLQKKDGQWTRAKGLDGFCPVGPIVTSGLDAAALRFTCRVNGEVRQEGDARNMIFSPAELVAYASRFFTLMPGDIFLTGTPEGVAPLSGGDELELEMPGVGVLRAKVAASGA